jgi:hypothetical protein
MDPFVDQLARLAVEHRTRAKWLFVPTHAIGRTLGDPTFLLVAYGLSFLAPDTPPATVPAEMPPWEPLRNTRQPVDQGEYYPP